MLPDFVCQRLKAGKVMLFLGAGASNGSKNRSGVNPPNSKQLCSMLAEEISVIYDQGKDSLRSLANVAERKLGTNQYGEFLRTSYMHCSPSKEYNSIASYPWPAIYTTNIDDALETAFRKISTQHTNVLNRTAPIVDRGHDLEEIRIVKLNGSVDLMHDGLVFSTNEYAKEALRPGTWYEKLAADYLSFTFIFIGTELDEPLFYHHVERLGSITGGTAGESYIVCPSFTEIQQEELESRNIKSVPGTLSDFVAFLENCLGKEHNTDDILKNNKPIFYDLIANLPEETKTKIRAEADSITVVQPESFDISEPMVGIRDFYFGAEPTWRDVIDGVPARLEFHSRVRKATESEVPVVVVHGSAGCGKSTAIRTVALEIGEERRDSSVFYVDNEYDFPEETIEILSSIDELQPIFVVDDFEWCHRSIRDLIEQGRANGATFLVAERSVAWGRIKRAYKNIRTKVIKVEQISKDDIPKLLDHLQRFGPWGRLARMSERDRFREIEDRADRQLLIALREATDGRRFDQILEDEYHRIQGDYEKLAFHLCGLATIHRLRLTHETFDSALRQRVGKIVIPRDSSLEGIIVDDGRSVSLRHSVIADYIIRRIASRDEIFDALTAALSAFTRFDSPVRWYTRNLDYQVYTALINHGFLRDLFRYRPELGLAVYKTFEKNFEKDGLFWLQYGLYEFDAGKRYRDQALNHIRLALANFPDSFQIIHAYANVHFSLAYDARDHSEARSLEQVRIDPDHILRA